MTHNSMLRGQLEELQGEGGHFRCSFCCVELGGAVSLCTVIVCVCVCVYVCVSLSDQTWSLSYEEQLLQRKCFVILNLEDTCINPEFIVVLRSLEIINNIPL